MRRYLLVLDRDLVTADEQSSPDPINYLAARQEEEPFFTNASMGGTVQANALATEQFWTRMITFLNHLPAHAP